MMTKKDQLFAEGEEERGRERERERENKKDRVRKLDWYLCVPFLSFKILMIDML